MTTLRSLTEEVTEQLRKLQHLGRSATHGDIADVLPNALYCLKEAAQLGLKVSTEEIEDAVHAIEEAYEEAINTQTYFGD